MLRLDYLSCVLTIVSTIMIGRRKWQGWVVAAINSGIICIIGVRTAQTGFIPANLFCLGLYAYNIFQWCGGREPATQAERIAGSSQSAAELATAQTAPAPIVARGPGRSTPSHAARTRPARRASSGRTISADPRHRMRPRSLPSR